MITKNISTSSAHVRLHGENGDNMEKDKTNVDDTLRPEYDLSKLKQVGERGRHAKRTRQGYTTEVTHGDGSKTITHYQVHPESVVVDRDVRAYFPNSEAVNHALRGLIALIPKKKVARQKATKK